MGKNKVPKVDELMDPSVQVLKSLGGSASIEELVPEIVRLLGLSQEVADVPHGTTSRTELEYRAAWARTYLRKAGLIENSERGIWALTPEGAKAAAVNGRQIARDVVKHFQSERATDNESGDPVAEAPQFSWTRIKGESDVEGGGGMVESRRVQGAGSARTEGARRATGISADGAAVGSGAVAAGQRWSARRKRDVVLRLLRGESLDAVSREVGLEVYRLEAWKARALAGIELGLKAQAGAPLAAELDAAKRHIGELSMEIELLRERARAAERRLPLTTRRSRR